jgi:alcohol/geraniol dehydrogenase (NADP+)
MDTLAATVVESEGQIIEAFAAAGPGATLTPHRYMPRPLGPMDVEIAITHCGMCHTDLHLINDDAGISTYPLVPGHEVVGTVTQMGSAVTTLSAGQRVGVGWLAGADLTCEQCTAGHDNLCASGQPTCLGREGGYATRIRVDARFAFPLPDGMSSEHAAPLLCAGITVFAPLLRHNISGNSRLGVIGIGGLGHLALQYGRALGCRVTAFSSSPGKAQEASSFGADTFVDTSNEEALAQHANTCDFIISTATSDLPWASYINVLRPNGKLCMVGVPNSAMAINALQLIFGQKSVISSIVGSRCEMRAMLEFSARHHIAPQVELFPMTAANMALERLRKNEVRYRAVLANV